MSGKRDVGTREGSVLCVSIEGEVRRGHIRTFTFPCVRGRLRHDFGTPESGYIIRSFHNDNIFTRDTWQHYH